MRRSRAQVPAGRGVAAPRRTGRRRARPGIRHRRWQAAGQHTVTAWGCYHLGQAQRGQGRLDAAAQTFQRALEITAAPGRPALPAAGPAYVGLAQVAYQRNELDVALGHVTEGIALCRQFVHTAPLAEGLLTLAWIRQASGDPAGALDAIGAAMATAPGPVRSAQPGPGPAGVAAAGPGGPGRSRALGAGKRSRGWRRAQTTSGSWDTWCWPSCCRPGNARPGARPAGSPVYGGTRPGPDRQRDRESARCGHWPCRPAVTMPPR